MSRPIYEPTLTRTDAVLGFGNDQLFRRPAPTASGIFTTSAYLDDWTFNGTGASIPDNTWSAVVTGFNGANDRWFDQSCVDPEGEWGINYATGAISNSAALAYNYTAWGYVVFDVPDGTVIGCQLSFTGQEVQVNTGPAVNGVSRIMCSAERTPLTADLRLFCYQNSGGAADLLEARLHARRFEIFEGVYDCQFAA